MKKLIYFIFLFLVMQIFPDKAFGWGVGTHAYFAEELGTHYGIENLPMIAYGAMAPDIFNLKFRLEYKDYLRDQTHYDFMKVMNNANGIRQNAFALGFAIHNDSWGADYTAHHNGRTTPGKGYIITKVDLLKTTLVNQVMDIVIASGVPEALAQTLAESVAPELTELFVETAVDLMIKRHENPLIGNLILQSAMFTDFEIDSLLVDAYAEDFAAEYSLTYEEARDIIAGAEKDYRELMKLHGEIFTKSESEAISLLAVQGAAITEAYLEKTTGLDLTVPPEIISVYEEFFLNHAIPAVEGDYSSEVMATLDYLEEQVLPLEVADMPSMPEFILFRNYPNPFNPSTTIEFSLNSGGYVTLDIFNISGQKINTLIAKNLSAGVHSVVWYGRDGNGSAVSSGIYFCWLRQKNQVTAHRMVLVR